VLLVALGCEPDIRRRVRPSPEARFEGSTGSRFGKTRSITVHPRPANLRRQTDVGHPAGRESDGIQTPRGRSRVMKEWCGQARSGRSGRARASIERSAPGVSGDLAVRMAAGYAAASRMLARLKKRDLALEKSRGSPSTGRIPYSLPAVMETRRALRAHDSRRCLPHRKAAVGSEDRSRTDACRLCRDISMTKPRQVRSGSAAE